MRRVPRMFRCMCFSATASFTAAGVTSVAGVAALRAAPRRSYMLLAVFPLFVAIHQFAEGVLWLSLTDVAPAGWSRAAMFTFLSFGEVVWPFWVPLALLAVEEDPARRKILTGLMVLGFALSVAQTYALVGYPVTAVIFGSHIKYHIDSPWLFRWVTDISYALTTILAPLISGRRIIRWIGVLLLLSAALSKLMFVQTFISVWCFFAAFISALLVLFIRGRVRGEATLAATTS